MIGGASYIDISDYKTKKKLNKNHFYCNGRIAFKSILEKINYKKYKEIYLPNYICESLIKSIPKKKFKIKFYEIDNTLNATFPNCKNSIILNIDYFGKKKIISKNIINKNIIIEDKTFSFQKNEKIKNKLQFYFASLRKIFPSLVCGISNLSNNKKKVFSNKIVDEYKIALAGYYLKKSYLKRNHYSRNKKIEKIYLNKISSIEKFFNDYNLNYNVDKIFINYFSYINFKKVYSNLLKNSLFIYKLLKYNNSINFIYDKNFIYPLIKTTKKKSLIKFLKNFDIFVSEYWERPKKLKQKKLSHNLYENLIIIPNNYNYKKKELMKVAKYLKLFFKKYENTNSRLISR
jgi:hypothetical protein